MEDKISPHIWEAADYHIHSTAQKDAASQLLQRIQLKGDEHILDVGCGDGKISAQIANNLTTGSVTGMDISQEMIRFAENTFSKEKYPNLIFSIGDAQKFKFTKTFDIIFSSFALQWLSDPSGFLECSYRCLNASGRIAATIPLGISIELEKAIQTIIACSEWSRYFQQFSPNWHFLTADKYNQLLAEHHFHTILSEVVVQTVIYPSRKSFENYVFQWFSYLNPLPQHLRLKFFEAIIDKYLEFNPMCRNQEISFRFLRCDLIAVKNQSLILK